MVQDLPTESEIEVVLVDNNCTDDTIQVARDIWNPDAGSLVVLKETAPGPEAARRCGLKFAKSDFVLCCDDDNWLAPTYVRLALDALRENPELAAVGGRGSVTANTEIPGWFDQFQGKYACHGRNAGGYVNSLVTAGLVIRKSAWDKLSAAGFTPVLSGRKGTEMHTGEDFELSYAFRLMGYKLLLCKDMQFQHFMPEGRLTESYLLQMCEGHGRSRSIFGEYRAALAGRRPGRCYASKLWLLLLARVLRFRLALLLRSAPKSLPEKVANATNKGSAAFDWELLSSGQVGIVARKLSGNVSNLRQSETISTDQDP